MAETSLFGLTPEAPRAQINDLGITLGSQMHGRQLADIQVGYIEADRRAWIGSKINRGLQVSVIVDRVIGGAGDMWMGMVIRLNVGGEMPSFDKDEGYGEILRRYG